jgi:hypothetical protein
MPFLPDAGIPNGILFDEDGTVLHDAYAEATGIRPFKTRAEYDEADAKFGAMLMRHRAEKAAEAATERAKSETPDVTVRFHR